MKMQFLEEQQLVPGKSVWIKFPHSCLALFRWMLKSLQFTRLLNQKLSYQEHTERDNVMLPFSESTSSTWRLRVKTAPKKPRYIIVAFQTAKDGDQTKNPSTFDHVNLKKF